MSAFARCVACLRSQSVGRVPDARVEHVRWRVTRSAEESHPASFEVERRQPFMCRATDRHGSRRARGPHACDTWARSRRRSSGCRSVEACACAGIWMLSGIARSHAAACPSAGIQMPGYSESRVLTPQRRTTMPAARAAAGPLRAVDLVALVTATQGTAESGVARARAFGSCSPGASRRIRFEHASHARQDHLFVDVRLGCADASA